MAPCSVGILFALLAVGESFVAKDTTPITKVIDLLQEMQKKGVAAKEEEANKFSAFKMWCSDQDRIKGAEIAASSEQIDMLNAEIMKSASLIRSLSSRIEELGEDVGRWKKDKKAATEVREMEQTDFRSTLQDYSESCDAIDQAIMVLKQQAHDRPQAEQALMMQLAKSRAIPEASKRMVIALLQSGVQDVPQKEWLESRHASPEAYGYEFQSGGVIDMLMHLKDDFRSKRHDLEREGLNAKNGYEQLMQRVADSLENANHEISKKTTLRAETEQAKAEDEGDLKQVTADKAEDEKYLKETQGLCAAKSADFDSRSKLRAEELEAIQKAIEILSSEQVSGTGERHLRSLLQKGPHRALAQLRSSGGELSPRQARVAAFLSERARKSNSRILSLAAKQISSGPFDKVSKLIKDLIIKLMEEATAETEKKGWCDAELATNKLNREHKTEEVSNLAAEKEDLESAVAQLAQEISDLSDAIAELEQAVAQATQERAESKAKNEATMAEARDSQKAVMQAIAVLKEFYAKSAEATAFVQQTPAEDAPETFTEPYQGMQGENQGVVGFLEVILSDFTRLESETSSTEATEADDFKNYVFESEKDKALKEVELNHKQTTRSEKESSLHATEDELRATQDQLDKALAYFEKLKPTCLNTGVTYEERVRHREEEMQSLQEALKILEGTDVDMS